MGSASIISFGIISAILLILSFLTLNAARFYVELESSTLIDLETDKPKLVLRDRS